MPVSFLLFPLLAIASSTISNFRKFRNSLPLSCNLWSEIPLKCLDVCHTGCGIKGKCENNELNFFFKRLKTYQDVRTYRGFLEHCKLPSLVLDHECWCFFWVVQCLMWLFFFPWHGRAQPKPQNRAKPSKKIILTLWRFPGTVWCTRDGFLGAAPPQ